MKGHKIIPSEENIELAGLVEAPLLAVTCCVEYQKDIVRVLVELGTLKLIETIFDRKGMKGEHDAQTGNGKAYCVWDEKILPRLRRNSGFHVE